VGRFRNDSSDFMMLFLLIFFWRIYSSSGSLQGPMLVHVATETCIDKNIQDNFQKYHQSMGRSRKDPSAACRRNKDRCSIWNCKVTEVSMARADKTYRANGVKAPTPCNDVPENFTIEGYWGYCNKVARHCEYLVVLNDPLLEILKEYTHHCSISENSIFLDFARKWNNRYTHLFSHSDQKPLTNLSKREYEAALKHLSSSEVTIVTPSSDHSMWKGVLNSRGIQSRSDEVESDCDAYSPKPDHDLARCKVSESDMETARILNEFDVRLFHSLSHGPVPNKPRASSPKQDLKTLSDLTVSEQKSVEHIPLEFPPNTPESMETKPPPFIRTKPRRSKKSRLPKGFSHKGFSKDSGHSSKHSDETKPLDAGSDQTWVEKETEVVQKAAMQGKQVESSSSVILSRALGVLAAVAVLFALNYVVTKGTRAMRLVMALSRCCAQRCGWCYQHWVVLSQSVLKRFPFLRRSGSHGSSAEAVSSLLPDARSDLQSFLVAAKLGQYESKLRSLGFAEPLDLVGASDADINILKVAERKRLRRALSLLFDTPTRRSPQPPAFSLSKWITPVVSFSRKQFDKLVSLLDQADDVGPPVPRPPRAPPPTNLSKTLYGKEGPKLPKGISGSSRPPRPPSHPLNARSVLGAGYGVPDNGGHTAADLMKGFTSTARQPRPPNQPPGSNPNPPPSMGGLRQPYPPPPQSAQSPSQSPSLSQGLAELDQYLDLDVNHGMSAERRVTWGQDQVRSIPPRLRNQNP